MAGRGLGPILEMLPLGSSNSTAHMSLLSIWKHPCSESEQHTDHSDLAMSYVGRGGVSCLHRLWATGDQTRPSSALGLVVSARWRLHSALRPNLSLRAAHLVQRRCRRDGVGFVSGNLGHLRAASTASDHAFAVEFHEVKSTVSATHFSKSVGLFAV